MSIQINSKSRLSKSARRWHGSWSDTWIHTPPPNSLRSFLKGAWKFGREMEVYSRSKPGLWHRHYLYLIGWHKLDISWILLRNDRELNKHKLVGMKSADLQLGWNADTIFTLIAGIISSEGGVPESQSVDRSFEFSISFLQKLSELVKFHRRMYICFDPFRRSGRGPSLSFTTKRAAFCRCGLKTWFSTRWVGSDSRKRTHCLQRNNLCLCRSNKALFFNSLGTQEFPQRIFWCLFSIVEQHAIGLVGFALTRNPSTG